MNEIPDSQRIVAEWRGAWRRRAQKHAEVVDREEKGFLEVQDVGRDQKPVQVPGGWLPDGAVLVAGDQVRVDAAAGRELALGEVEEDLSQELDEQRRRAEIVLRERIPLLMRRRNCHESNRVL